MSHFTLEKAITNAVNDAEHLIKAGLFISDIDFDWDDPENYKNGDPENVNTLVSLYGQFLTPEDADKLYDFLSEKYPNHV